MKTRFRCLFAVACLVAAVSASCYGQIPAGIPRLQKQGSATQLIVDGKPFLAVTGELGNNSASSLENMQPVWARLLSGNLNSVLAHTGCMFSRLEAELF